MKEKRKVYLKEKSVIGRLIPIKPVERKVILAGEINKNDKQYFFDKHPYQMEVVYVSNDFVLTEANSDKKVIVKPGDVLYLDRESSERELLLIDKEVLAIALMGNVLLCIPKEEALIDRLASSSKQDESIN